MFKILGSNLGNAEFMFNYDEDIIVYKNVTSEIIGDHDAVYVDIVEGVIEYIVNKSIKRYKIKEIVLDEIT